MTSRPGFAVWMAPLAVLTLLAVWRLLLAATLPVTQDEAYYFHWARALAWGYFDHPPGVALLSLGHRWWPDSVLAARFGTWLAANVSLVLLWRFYARCGLSGHQQTLALILVGTTLPGVAFGVIATPDTALALCWVLALHEGLAALQGERPRWLSAGLATGLGLLSKYTMVLMGPVLLLALVMADRAALRTRWPYLGALLALMIFLPNVLWNAAHDWLTIRFQLGHGLELATGALLPTAIETTTASSLVQLAPTHSERAAQVGGFVLSQLLFWGFLLVALGWRRGNAPPPAPLSQPAQALLWAATLVPLVFFAVTAWISSTVQPNWSAMYLFTAAAVLAQWRLSLRLVLAASVANALLLSLYVLYAADSSALPGNPPPRLLRETHGFAELAATLPPAPLFADRYQIAAMVNFYRPALQVGQWPGITRPSEYLRGTLTPSADSLHNDHFWLITYKSTAPSIKGFQVAEQQTLVDCRRQPLQPWAEGAPPPCEQPLHVFRLYHYVINSAQP